MEQVTNCKINKTITKWYSDKGPKIYKIKFINVKLYEYVNLFVLWSIIGSLCLGHGIKLNNCGKDKKKFKNCGIKNNINVLE